MPSTKKSAVVFFIPATRERPRRRKAADDAREWKLHQTIYWADNSVEEIWIDKNGATKSVMTVGPHGDAC